MRRVVATGLLIAYLTVLFGLTLCAFNQPHAPRNFLPFHTIGFDLRVGGWPLLINLLGNLAAFLPMGVLVPSLIPGRRPAVRVALASLGLSLLIEVLQGLSGSRVADVDDLILNTLGGLIGYAMMIAHRSTFGRGMPSMARAELIPNKGPASTNHFGDQTFPEDAHGSIGRFRARSSTVLQGDEGPGDGDPAGGAGPGLVRPGIPSGRAADDRPVRTRGDECPLQPE